jgi:para-aminobenzoate synthetase / 4-amino-4-deoxychorismate lyase
MRIIEILKYVEENTNSAFFYTPNVYKEGKSYLFKKPYKTLRGKSKDEIEEILNQVDELSQDSNLIGFATIPYEIGYDFQPKEIKKSYLGKTELSFFFYEKQNVEIIDSDRLIFDDVESYIKSNHGIQNFELEILENEYIEKINKIKKYITEGDTYQINFTTKAKFKYDGELKSLFLNGIFNQSASYSVLINTENEFILSFSPELFFRTDYQTIYSKPMKGTLKRRGNPVEDEKLGKSLLYDEKNLAENVMIVDLMRNDIGRIAATDSVKVEKLYEVEKYETLFQLTSTVVGKLKENKLSEIFKNMFPSGSITGAPKIRSMQIIAELEKSSRNLYTGSIGLITSANAVFNIPIRTITINKGTKDSELGLGSGIVWDSDAKSEYEEVLLKGKFISSPQKYFELLETMLFDNGECFLLDYHLKRLKSAADYFLFKYDESKIATAIQNVTARFTKNKKYKVRLVLSKWGNLKIEIDEINKTINEAKVLLSKINRCDEEKFLYHKTTYRPWDEQFKIATQKGFDEVLFINRNDELLEGAVTNLLIKKDGKQFTPPIGLGILNGCYRQYLLDNKICSEKVLRVDDLKNADKIILCNSVRKKILVNRIYDPEGKLVFNS